MRLLLILNVLLFLGGCAYGTSDTIPPTLNPSLNYNGSEC